MRKYWISQDGQSELGSWDENTADETILNELLSQRGTDQDRDEILAGEIRLGDWE